MRKILGVISFVCLAFANAGVARSEPLQVPDEFISRSNGWENNVSLIRSLLSRGILKSELASSQMYLTLEQAIGAVRASRFGANLQAGTVSNALEQNWIWWVETGVTPKGGEPIATQMLIHNRTDAVVNGVIIELADRSCEFKKTAPKVFILLSFQSNSILRPNDLAVFRTSFPTSRSMFTNSGGSWCATIVRGF